MIDYRNFSYKPDYGYKIYLDGKILESKNKVPYAVCFSRVFWLLDRPNNPTYLGQYTLRCRKEFKCRSGNYCVLNKKDIQKIMCYMRKNFNMCITMSETVQDYIFKMSIEGTAIKHKFILTFCRVFYEFPFNEAAKEALFLRSLKTYDGVYYGNRSFLELYNVVCAGYTSKWASGHSLFYTPATNTNIKIFKRACKVETKRVQDVYDHPKELYDKTIRVDHPESLNWEENIESRLPRHSQNFKIIKAFKDEQKKNLRRRKRAGVQ